MEGIKTVILPVSLILLILLIPCIPVNFLLLLRNFCRSKSWQLKLPLRFVAFDVNEFPGMQRERVRIHSFDVRFFQPIGRGELEGILNFFHARNLYSWFLQIKKASLNNRTTLFCLVKT